MLFLNPASVLFLAQAKKLLNDINETKTFKRQAKLNQDRNEKIYEENKKQQNQRFTKTS